MMKRGVVVSLGYELLEDGGIISSGKQAVDDLRKYLLYWDEIDCPQNNCFNNSPPEISFLEKTKYLKRTFSQYERLGGHDIAIKPQEFAFQKNIKEEPGCWVIAQQSTTPYYTEQKQGTAFEVELKNLLPVPSSDTPLNDILEFKEKRQGEIDAFNLFMEDINLKIINSADIIRSGNAEVKRLELAIKDLDSALGDSLIKRTYENARHIINTELAGVAAASTGAMGSSAYAFTSVAPPLALIAGAGLYIGTRVLSMPTSIPAHFNYLKSVKTQL